MAEADQGRGYPQERERRVLDVDGMAGLLKTHFPGVDANLVKRKIRKACMTHRIPAWKHPITGHWAIFEDELLSCFRRRQNEANDNAL